MNFEYSDKVKGLLRQVRNFMEANIYPNETLFEQQVAATPWETAEIVTGLKQKARAAGFEIAQGRLGPGPGAAPASRGLSP